MISGVYKLTLTCSVCGKDDGGYRSLSVFDGKNSEDALHKCLNAGWRINMTEGKQICPVCVKEGKT